MSVFKLFVLDIGLMGAMSDAPAESVIVADTLFKEYKGAFTELFVLTQLITEDLPIYYFSSNDSRVEIDLVVQKGTTVVPIEIKAEENVHAKSLRTFIGKHPGLEGSASFHDAIPRPGMDGEQTFVCCWRLGVD